MQALLPKKCAGDTQKTVASSVPNSPDPGVRQWPLPLDAGSSPGTENQRPAPFSGILRSPTLRPAFPSGNCGLPAAPAATQVPVPVPPSQIPAPISPASHRGPPKLDRLRVKSACGWAVRRPLGGGARGAARPSGLPALCGTCGGDSEGRSRPRAAEPGLRAARLAPHGARECRDWSRLAAVSRKPQSRSSLPIALVAAESRTQPLARRPRRTTVSRSPAPDRSLPERAPRRGARV